MSRVTITPELSDTIKKLRTQNKIQAKLLAAHIEKSPAYITKLENHEIQTVDADELPEIFQFITKESSEAKSAEQIYNSLERHYTKEEIENQLWFTNFDTVIRKIPIPEQLVDEINNIMESEDISISYLTERINSNEALPDNDINDESIEFNQWYIKDDNASRSRIKIQISEDQVNRILNKSEEVSSYIFVFCILFYALKIKHYKDAIKIDDDTYQKLYKETTSKLNLYKFFSISAKNILYKQEKKNPNKDIEKLLNNFDKENNGYIIEILSKIILASEYNIKNTNAQLSAFTQNLNWDLGFMLRLLSMDFSTLTNTSVSNKKELLNDIEKLIKKYQELPSELNLIENY